MEIKQLEDTTLDTDTFFRVDDETLITVSLICPEGTCVTVCRLGEAQSHSPSFTAGVGPRRKAGVCSELDGAKGQGTARWGYPLPGSGCRHETETTANPCQGNSCRILPCGSGSEVGQDFRPPTPAPEASPAAVPDGCLAPRTSLGLSPELLGPTWAWRVMSLASCEGCKLAQVGGAGCFSPMCFHCRCWQVWKLHIAWKPFDGHSPLRPNKTVPLPGALSV